MDAIEANTTSLSDLSIRQAKAGETLRKLSDGGGLQLWIKPNGSKLWCLAYRGSAGKQKKYSIGPYPTVTLAEAREKRDKAKRLLLAGLDPVEHFRTDKPNKALEKANSDANTFAVIAAELLAKKRREGKASNTIGKREWLYSLAGDAFGKRPVAEISSAEILRILQKVEEKGHFETASRLRAGIGEVFRFAIAIAIAIAIATDGTGIARSVVVGTVGPFPAGQRKLIRLVTRTGASDTFSMDAASPLKPSGAAVTSLTFNAAVQSALLEWNGRRWVVLDTIGAVLV